MTTDLTPKQGDTFRATLTVTDETGAVVDLTGATLTLHVRLPGASTDILTIALSLLVAAEGTATITLTPVQTAALTPYIRHVYEVEMVDTLNNVWTPVEGNLYVKPDRG